MDDVYALIAKRYDEMSKTQKKIASYLLEEKTNASFYNIKKLAGQIAVSEASIIRFANFLGFSGYSELQHLIQEKTRAELNTKERLALSYHAYKEKKSGIEDIFNEEMDHIKSTLAGIDSSSLFRIVDKIINAKKIIIVGGRSALSLCIFFEYYLKIVLGNVYLIDTFDGNEEILNSIDSEDLIIGISFQRYTKRTVELLEYIKEKNSNIAVITDKLTSPLIKYADHYLLAETQMSTYLDSFVAPLTLINTILVYVGKARNKDLEKRFTELEEMWDQMNVFVKPEL